jgi:hypothetical protein
MVHIKPIHLAASKSSFSLRQDIPITMTGLNTAYPCDCTGNYLDWNRTGPLQTEADAWCQKAGQLAPQTGLAWGGSGVQVYLTNLDTAAFPVTGDWYASSMSWIDITCGGNMSGHCNLSGKAFWGRDWIPTPPYVMDNVFWSQQTTFTATAPELSTNATKNTLGQKAAVEFAAPKLPGPNPAPMRRTSQANGWAGCTNNSLSDTNALQQGYQRMDSFLKNNQAPGHTETLVFTGDYKIYVDNEEDQRTIYFPAFDGAMGSIDIYCGDTGSGYYFDPDDGICYGRDLVSAQSCPPKPPTTQAEAPV